MREVRGNLWTYPADWRCITTNGFVKTSGHAVMGRGCALEATMKYPSLSGQLGILINNFGNRVHIFNRYNLFTFPVKHDWKNKADIQLIERSAKELRDFADELKIKSIVVPRPGCGNGGLSWEEVKPVLEPYFDNRFIIITF